MVSGPCHQPKPTGSNPPSLSPVFNVQIPKDVIFNILRYFPFSFTAQSFVRLNRSARDLGTLALKEALKTWMLNVLDSLGKKVPEKYPLIHAELEKCKSDVRSLDLKSALLWDEIVKMRIKIEFFISARVKLEELPELELSSLCFRHPFKSWIVEIGRTIAYLSNANFFSHSQEATLTADQTVRQNRLKSLEGPHVSGVFQHLLQQGHTEAAVSFAQKYSDRLYCNDPAIIYLAGADCLAANNVSVLQRLCQNNDATIQQKWLMNAIDTVFNKVEHEHWSTDHKHPIDEEYLLKPRAWAPPVPKQLTSITLKQYVLACKPGDHVLYWGSFLFLQRRDFPAFLWLWEIAHKESLKTEPNVSFTDYVGKSMCFHRAHIDRRFAPLVLTLCCWDSLSDDLRKPLLLNIVETLDYGKFETVVNLITALTFVDDPQTSRYILSQAFLRLQKEIEYGFFLVNSKILPRPFKERSFYFLTRLYLNDCERWFCLFFCNFPSKVVENFVSLYRLIKKNPPPLISTAEPFYNVGSPKATVQGLVNAVNARLVPEQFTPEFYEQYSLYSFAALPAQHENGLCDALKRVFELPLVKQKEHLYLYFLLDFTPFIECEAKGLLFQEMSFEGLIHWYLVRAKNYRSPEALELIRGLCQRHGRGDLIPLTSDVLKAGVRKNWNSDNLRWRSALEFILNAKREWFLESSPNFLDELLLDCLMSHPKIEIEEGKGVVRTSSHKLTALIMYWHNGFVEALIDFLYCLSKLKKQELSSAVQTEIMHIVQTQNPDLEHFARICIKAHSRCDAELDRQVDTEYAQQDMDPDIREVIRKQKQQASKDLADFREELLLLSRTRIQ